MGNTRERIIEIMMVGDPFGSAANIAGEIDAKDKRIAELEGLLREAETMIKNADVSVNTLTKAGDMLAARLDQALAEVERLKPKPIVLTALLLTEKEAEEYKNAVATIERMKATSTVPL